MTHIAQIPFCTGQNSAYGTLPFGKAFRRALMRACMIVTLAAIAHLPGPALAKSSEEGGAGEMDRMIAVVPMPISIIQKSRIQGILIVEFYIEATSGAQADTIRQLMPRLLDAYRTGLNEFATHQIRLDRPVNLDRLDRYLTRETGNVLGKSKTRIIFRQVMVQK